MLTINFLILPNENQKLFIKGNGFYNSVYFQLQIKKMHQA